MSRYRTGVSSSYNDADQRFIDRLKVTGLRPRIQELVDAGDAIPVRVEGWKDPAYLAPGATAASVPM